MLLEVSVNLLSCLRQVPLLNSVVPFPHLLRLVPNYSHCRGCIHPRPSEVGSGSVAQVVQPEIRYARVHEGGLEGPAYPLKRSALIRENVPCGKLILSMDHPQCGALRNPVTPRRIQLDQAAIIQHFAKLLMSTLHAQFRAGN